MFLKSELYFRHPARESPHSCAAARKQGATRCSWGAPERHRAHHVQVPAAHEPPPPPDEARQQLHRQQREGGGEWKVTYRVTDGHLPRLGWLRFEMPLHLAQLNCLASSAKFPPALAKYKVVATQARQRRSPFLSLRSIKSLWHEFYDVLSQ